MSGICTVSWKDIILMTATLSNPKWHLKNSFTATCSCLWDTVYIFSHVKNAPGQYVIYFCKFITTVQIRCYATTFASGARITITDLIIIGNIWLNEKDWHAEIISGIEKQKNSLYTPWGRKKGTDFLLRVSFLILDRNWWIFSHTLRKAYVNYCNYSYFVFCYHFVVK